jgi:hypothetical protein
MGWTTFDLEPEESMMKPIAAVARHAGLMALLLAGAGAQAASDSATATAVVLIPIAITKTADMNFGNMVEGNGTITLNTDGSRSKSGTSPLVAAGSSPTAAAFHVTGDSSQTFAISYPSAPTTLAGPSSSTMAFTYCSEVTATNAASSATCPTAATTGTLSSGSAYIFVGGTVTATTGQTTGTYTGTLTVSVDYN